MKKQITALLLLVALVFTAGQVAASGPTFYKTITPGTAGEVVILKDKYEITKNTVLYIGCADDDFVVTGWHYTSGSYQLIIPVNPDYSDTTTATGLAGMIVPINGLIDAIVVKTMTTEDSKVTIQSYTE